MAPAQDSVPCRHAQQLPLGQAEDDTFLVAQHTFACMLGLRALAGLVPDLHLQAWDAWDRGAVRLMLGLAGDLCALFPAGKLAAALHCIRWMAPYQ